MLLTADLAKLPVAGKALKKDPTMLQAPMAINSCEASTSYRFRMASAFATAMLSRYSIKGTMPMPAPSDAIESDAESVVFLATLICRKGLCKGRKS